MNDNELNAIATGFARDIIDQVKYDDAYEQGTDGFEDECRDKIHQYVDSSEHVLFSQNALQIYLNCDTEQGEDFLDDIGFWDDIPKKQRSLSAIACVIVYGELHSRVECFLSTLLEKESES